MTTPDRPSVTDNARATWADLPPDVQQHMRDAWDEGWVHGTDALDGPGDLRDNPYRAAGRAETTTATDEDVAAILRDHADMTDRSADDGCRCGDPRTDYTHQAEVLAAAGLLARPTPTRKDLMRLGLYGKQADAVLDLLQGGGDE